MSDSRTPSDPGQNPHPSSASSFDPSELLAELLAFRRDFERALPRLRAAADRIEAKLRASGVDVDVDVAVMAGPPMPEPPFAVFSDGSVLMSTKALDGRDMGERDVWTGVVLSASDVAFVMGRLDNAAHETACHLAALYPWKGEQPSSDNDSDENEDEDNEGGDNE